MLPLEPYDLSGLAGAPTQKTNTNKDKPSHKNEIRSIRKKRTTTRDRRDDIGLDVQGSCVEISVQNSEYVIFHMRGFLVSHVIHTSVDCNRLS